MDSKQSALQYVIETFSHLELTDGEVNAIKSILKPVSLKKNEFFLRENKPCKHFGILIEGTLYAYNYDKNGEEVIHHFYYNPEQLLIFNYKDYLQKNPSSLNIKCFTEASLIIIDVSKTEDVMEEFPRLYQLESMVIQNHFFVDNLKRNSLLKQINNHQKIEMLQQQSPEIFLHFPYTHIASYLGMHRNTFRRSLSKL